MIKIDFNQNLDYIEGDDDNSAFKQQLVGLLRKTDSAEDVYEGAILDDLAQKIAGSDEPIEVSEEALDVLEDNINRLMNKEDSQLPNWLVGTVGRLMKEGRENLDNSSTEE